MTPHMSLSISATAAGELSKSLTLQNQSMNGWMSIYVGPIKYVT